MYKLLLIVTWVLYDFLILLIAVKQVHCLKKRVWRHILGESTLATETGAVFACAIATCQLIGEKVNFSYHFAIIYGAFTVGKGLEQTENNILFHSLNTESACLGCLSLAGFLAFYLWDIEVVDFALGENTLEEFSYLLATAVGVGEDNDAILSKPADKRLLFLVIKDRKTACGDDICVKKAREGRLIVSTLYDDRQSDLNFFHFPSPS